MATTMLAVAVVVMVAFFVGLWLWSRTTERDDIDWQHGAQTDDRQKRLSQLGIGIPGRGH